MKKPPVWRTKTKEELYEDLKKKVQAYIDNPHEAHHFLSLNMSLANIKMYEREIENEYGNN